LTSLKQKNTCPFLRCTCLALFRAIEKQNEALLKLFIEPIEMRSTFRFMFRKAHRPILTGFVVSRTRSKLFFGCISSFTFVDLGYEVCWKIRNKKIGWIGGGTL